MYIYIFIYTLFSFKVSVPLKLLFVNSRGGIIVNNFKFFFLFMNTLKKNPKKLTQLKKNYHSSGFLYTKYSCSPFSSGLWCTFQFKLLRLLEIQTTIWTCNVLSSAITNGCLYSFWKYYCHHFLLDYVTNTGKTGII